MPKESVAAKEQYEKVYEHLKKVRASTTVEIKPTPMMRTEIRGFDGSMEPLRIRYYQVQGIYHLLVMNRMVLGDSTGTGKTLQAIGALCYIWERDPEVKVIVVCPKSAIGQWASEIDKFSVGVKTFQATGTLDKRKEAYQGWANHKGPAVLILNYALVIRDWDQGVTKAEPPPGAKRGTVVLAGRGYLDELTSKMPKLSVIFDEVQACKTPSTKTHQTCKFLADRCKRVWGLTATLLQNHLIEGFGIYKVIRPQTFGSKYGFLNTYCVTEMQRVRGGGKIPIIVGYKNLAHFRETIDPFFYGRQKHEICKELPALTTREVICELSPAEDRKYQEALSGVFELGTGEIKDYTETKQMTSLIYIQEVCNSLSLVKFGEDEFDRPVTSTEGRSSKEAALVELLSEEFDGEKVIVYTRFKSHLPRLQAILTKEGIKSVVISGDVTKASARKAAQDKFQDPNSKIRVIFITDAGSESINLQAASAMIFFDSPWSWGKYVQCLDLTTEILTNRGFLGYTELDETDLVASLDPKTSEVTWQPVLSKVVRPLAEGESIYELKSPHLDIRVTGGHRMVFKRQSTKDKKKIWPREWRFKTSEDLADEKSLYRIPISGVESNVGVQLSDPELRFIGWYLTDGTLNRKIHQVQITQAVHQPQIKELRECLRECGFDWKENLRDPSKIKGCFPNGKPQVKFCIPKGTGKGSRKRNGWVHLEKFLNKDFPPEFETLTRVQLGVLLEAIHLGDGYKQRGQLWTPRSYHIFTGNPLFADRLQSLCVRRGFKCNITPRGDGYTLHIKDTQVITLMGAKSQARPGFVLSKSTPQEQVWCVENPVGTIFTRRNGKVAVLGNCLGRMIRIGSPHQAVFAVHLLAKRPGVGKKSETIDHKVIQKLRKKKGLIDQVIGEAAVGALKFERNEDAVKELLNSLRETVRK